PVTSLPRAAAWFASARIKQEGINGLRIPGCGPTRSAHDAHRARDQQLERQPASHQRRPAACFISLHLYGGEPSLLRDGLHPFRRFIYEQTDLLNSSRQLADDVA